MITPIKNKGMFLEEILNITHIKYKEENICTISKIPTNIGIIKSTNKKINEAFFKESSSCDYIGNMNGRYFEFEAKETYKDYFDWSTGMRKNQINKLNEVLVTNGLAFLIIYFGEKEKFYLVDFALLQFTVNNFGKKVPFSWFEENAYDLNINHELKLDYLEYLKYLTNWI